MALLQIQVLTSTTVQCECGHMEKNTAGHGRVVLGHTNREKNTKDVTQGVLCKTAAEKREQIKPVEIDQVILGIQNLCLETTDKDGEDRHNSLMCTEYATDIYKYLREKEVATPFNHRYMEYQLVTTPKMRATLADWLIRVHMRFDLVPKTLFLTVAIIDHFLESFVATKEQLQLVGVTSMFIAAKYEEVHHPHIKDFAFITADTYTTDTICQMERIILKTLDYALSFPLAITFLRRLSKITTASSEEHNMAKLLTELALINYRMLSFTASLTAASALYLALHLLRPQHQHHWLALLQLHSGYTERELHVCTVGLAKQVIQMPHSRLQAVPQKYSNSKYFKVATNLELYSKKVQDIAASNSDY